MEKLEPKKAEKELEKFEQAIRDLRVKYDQYFFGLERKPPVDEREKLGKWMLKVLNYYLPNTQLRFRRDMLVARLNSYSNMWDRTLSQIEAGTYRPDVVKADMRIGKFEAKDVAARKPEARPAVQDRAAQEKIEPAAPKAAPSVQPAIAKPKEPGHKKLYREYVEARQKLGLPTSITMDSFKDMIKNQVDQIQKKFGFTEVELRVSIEDNKVKIKGTPKK